MNLAFVDHAHDRCEDLRRDPEKLREMFAAGNRLLFRVTGDQIEAEDGLPRGSAEGILEESVFLGRLPSGEPAFAAAASADAILAPLRGLMLTGQVAPPLLTLLAQARSLVHWHESHSFCAKCGAKSEMRDGGYRRHCEACKADHFPRTDPVVIMAVTWNRHVLLGRQASWPAGMYSTLAGFMEPGETIEDAARREVFEESGIRVGAVRYQQSQPWPFPSSLMIGLIGEALTHEIRVDTHELEDARWFSFAEALTMVDKTHPLGLIASNPYAIAHHLVKAALST